MPGLEHRRDSDRWLAGAAQMGVPLTPAQAAQVEAYLDLLQRWGSVYNLTAIRDREAMRVHHVLDSLSIVPILDRWLDDGGEPSLLDVGSGAGLPGVILAISRPAWSVGCVDTVGKKAGFIQQVAAELGLRNLESFHGRVESLPNDARWSARWPNGVGIVVSRAFASLVDFIRWTEPVLSRRGAWLAMKGQRPDAELADLAEWAASLGPAGMGGSAQAWQFGEPILRELRVPGLAAQRCLVEIRRMDEGGGRAGRGER